ncbi:hypothetical protein JKI95_03350 [Corynebacterium aquatimens]|uniref:hypothetical protein n=1 Tax=Corynebacterium TaxID=1716 RepID=UPI001F3D8794|nr:MULTISPECIES: hypothetical protein [Corynebacterium]QYH20066.1 hypothetical protein JKI95_03350 [Corynebacterium aquatimens]UIZ92722.1 hypothetical protein JZY91_02830 [Corynebacterium sp. CNCTC7651]
MALSSRITAALLAFGISFPGIPTVYELPVVGPVLVQAYHGAPEQLRHRLPAPPRPHQQEQAGGDPAARQLISQAELDQLVRAVEARHGGRASISVAGVEGHLTAGDNRPVGAYSTMKVPSAIAALRKDPGTYPDARAAVTRSDNDAAHRLNNVVSGRDLADVIAQAGSRTTNSAGWRMDTLWTTADQAQFASGVRCVPGHEPVLAMMGEIVPDQRWGLGRIPGARFKGGWADSPDGFVARQFGLIPGPHGDVAVAITAVNRGGYQASVATLNELADGIARQSGDLPRARC